MSRDHHVLVTGANGYLGTHIVAGLLANFKVVGTVRSDVKGRTLARLLNHSDFLYVVVDLKDHKAVGQVIERFRVWAIVHTAAPYNFGLKDYVNSVIDPIIRMMESLINVCTRYPDISTFIYTSAFSAHHNLEMYSNDALTLTEASWCTYSYVEGVENPFKAYHYAKATAERMFWRFVHDHPPIHATAISPCFMFGPQPFDDICLGPLNASAQLFNIILDAGPHGADNIPHLFGYVSDVRDIAKIHIQALTDSNLWGQRLLPFRGQFTTAEILLIAKTWFSLSLILPPEFPIHVQLVRIDNSHTRKLITWQMIDKNSCLFDSLQQLIKVRYTSRTSLNR